MKKIKWLMSIFTIFFIVCVFAYGGTGKKEEKAPAEGPMAGMVVGHLPGNLVDSLRLTWSNKMEDVIKEAGGTVITIDSQNDVTKQVSDGEDILQRKIDILVINPNDADAMVPIVEKANSMGIPVVCMDRTVNGGKIVTTVEFDNWKAGYEAGEFIAKESKKKGNVMQLQGTLGASVVYERGQSFRDAIAKYPNMKIVNEPSSKGWTTEDALAFTEDTLSAHPDLVGIWAHSDSMILGAYRAVEAAGKLDQIILVGMGLYSGIPELIKEGKGRLYTWALLPEEVGKAAGEVCIKIAQGKLSEIEKITRTPLIWVDHNNIEENWKYKLD